MGHLPLRTSLPPVFISQSLHLREQLGARSSPHTRDGAGPRLWDTVVLQGGPADRVPPHLRPPGHLSTWMCEAVRVNTMTGGLDLSFGFPQNGKIPHPHQVTWSQPINMLPVGNKGRAEKPAKFVPIKLLCKHVANQLKPATNRLCIPYKFG